MSESAVPVPSVYGASRGHFLARVWALITPYWRSEEKGKAWLLLSVVIALSLAGVGLSVALNTWYRYFYDALQNRDLAAFIRLMLYFCGLAATAILLAVYRLYLTQALTINWRRWLTEKHFGLWLSDRNYYQLEREGGADNPDQRLTEDIRDFADTTLSLGLGFIRTVVSLVSFGVILFGISGDITLFGITIPAYMFWAALIYAAVGTWLTHLIGRRLIGLYNQQQRYEADLRFGLIRVREKAESVALFRGEANEHRRLLDRFGYVWGNYHLVMNYTKRLTFFTAGYSQIAIIAGFVLAAPRYFSGKIQLGDLMQINSAFGNVQESLSWFVDAYVSLAGWRAVSDRLLTFRETMAEFSQETDILVPHASDSDLILEGLSLGAAGRLLLHPTDLRIARGEHLLIEGASGSGKSTLLRALAGLWRQGQGGIAVPPGRQLFLPQQPYLPIGTLREALAYPQPVEAYTDERLTEVLRHCRLDQLVEHLDESRHWERTLSPGEQQRVALARALLYAPDWLFLDEASSALSEADERALYERLLTENPGLTLVSVGHRPSLRAYHRRHLLLEGQELRPRAVGEAS
ncbi:putative ATP-binding cassette transporter [Pseudomonas sp. SORGH_AS 211]|uniref:ABC transporter ATP-binding protein/permease n=1 Tax=Pseudomonas sp. SORGH_AS_0211 TaxID=3041796 RepID=UPI002860619C|nr:ABC transporter ATP-binding protein/permease [Pseudomonas sp. SORGH_AS_0211]MDR6177410.1 putative ATP-binding cassette transporter [Pseudomonas sp. SORGH_AS_0211]